MIVHISLGEPLRCSVWLRSGVGFPAGLRSSLFARETALALNAFNFGAQPVGQSLFHLRLAARTVEIIHGPAVLGQRNETARHVLAPLIFRHKSRQQAALARLRVRRIAKVRTYGGIFKDRGSPPGRARRASVPAIFHEAQFKLEYFQNVSTILRHRPPQRGSQNARQAWETPCIPSRGIVIWVTTERPA